MKKGIAFAVSCLLVMMMVSGGAAAKAIQAKFGHGNNPTDPRHEAAVLFAQLVAEKTDGAIEVQVFPSASLGSDEDMIEQLQLNISQFAAPGVGTISPLAPDLNVLEMPFLFDSFEKAWKVLDGPVGQRLVEPLPPKGIRVLAFWENGFRNVTNGRRPIEKPEDLVGLKIRVPNWEMSIATFQAMEAQVTPMAWPEVYLALQQGTIDAQENPLTVIAQAGLYEVQRYLSLTRHQYSPLPLLVSERFWQSLSKEHQDAIMEAAHEAKVFHRNRIASDDERLVSELQAKGMIVSYPDIEPFREKAQAVYKRYGERFGSLLDEILAGTE
jgi:tripartite ATP-independent transporter DctP family solute receptor